MNWYLDAWKNYANFQGRARRKAYWMFVLFNMIALVAAGAIDNMLGVGGISDAVFVDDNSDSHLGSRYHPDFEFLFGEQIAQLCRCAGA